jgi:hypothetical protein
MSDTVIVKSALSIGLEIRIVTGNGAEYALQLRGMNARGFEVRVTGLDPEKSLDNAIQQNQKTLCGRSRILGKALPPAQACRGSECAQPHPHACLLRSTSLHRVPSWSENLHAGQERTFCSSTEWISAPQERGVVRVVKGSGDEDCPDSKSVRQHRHVPAPS